MKKVITGLGIKPLVPVFLLCSFITDLFKPTFTVNYALNITLDYTLDKEVSKKIRELFIFKDMPFELVRIKR